MLPPTNLLILCLAWLLSLGSIEIPDSEREGLINDIIAFLCHGWLWRLSFQITHVGWVEGSMVYGLAMGEAIWGSHTPYHFNSLILFVVRLLYRDTTLGEYAQQFESFWDYICINLMGISRWILKTIILNLRFYFGYSAAWIFGFNYYCSSFFKREVASLFLI